MADDDLREFIREQTLRYEKAAERTERWLRIADRRTDEMIKRGDEMIRRSDVMISRGDRLIAEIAELREEFRAEAQAQRAALFAMMDKLNGGAPPPASA